MPDIADGKKTEFPSQSKLQSPGRTRRSPVRIIVPLAILILLVGGYFIWKYLNTYESTDDAQIDGHINAISARISGNVIEVRAEDEQCGEGRRRAGPDRPEGLRSRGRQGGSGPGRCRGGARKLAHRYSDHHHQHGESVEDGDIQARVDATAFVMGAQRQLDAAQARLESAQAQVREAEANLKKASDDVARYKLLVDKNEIPRQQYDTQCGSRGSR